MEMKRATIAIIAASLLSGCADQVTYEKTDYCALEYQNCEASLDEDRCLTLTAPATCHPSKDAADCVIGGKCPNEADEADAYQGSFEGNTASSQNNSPGYVGVIDRKCHTLKEALNEELVGGDVDIIPINAEPGTPIKVEAYRVLGSRIQPVLYLRSKMGGNLIYSLPDKNGFTSMSFLAPDDLFYISVEEKDNLDIDYASRCYDSDVTGGEKYQYVLTVDRDSAFNVVTIGTFDSDVIPEPQHFSASGQSHYYKFSGSKNKKVIVTVQPLPKSPLSAIPVVSPLSKNAMDGTSSYSWVLYGKSLKSSTSRDEHYLNFTKIEFSSEYGECDDDNCQYMIAVTDYEGNYDYDYQLSISLR